jgi:hypothetical protein
MSQLEEVELILSSYVLSMLQDPLTARLFIYNDLTQQLLGKQSADGRKQGTVYLQGHLSRCRPLMCAQLLAAQAGSRHFSAALSHAWR